MGWEARRTHLRLIGPKGEMGGLGQATTSYLHMAQLGPTKLS